jgi:hypothetical protein
LPVTEELVIELTTLEKVIREINATTFCKSHSDRAVGEFGDVYFRRIYGWKMCGMFLFW